ncbi:MAG: transporter [Acidobacteriota bacterium]
MKVTLSSLVRTLAVGAGAFLLPVALLAGEQGHYLPNSWSPRDLISAPAGLLVVAPYASFYDADRARTGSGEKVDASTGIDVGASSWAFTPVLVYAPSAKPFGAEWTVTVVPAFGEAGANARLTAFGYDITLFDNNNRGVGDLYVVPANLTWHLGPTWALSAQYSFWAPVGEYDAGRADNVGLGYWSHDFRGTVSYFPLGNPGLLLSASVVHEINGRKEGFDLRPAPHTTAELGASIAFSERLMCGVMAGAIWETGDATGEDAAEDGRDRMVNVSVEATYWFVPGKLGTMARVTREFEARDRFEGTLLTVGLNYLF